MKYIKNLILVFVAMILIATSSFAQQGPSGKTGPAFNVGQKWLETVNINTQFPDPDKIKIGDTVKVSMENKTVVFVADSTLNSQWAVTMAAMKKMAVNKEAPINVEVISKEDFGSFPLIYGLLICIGILLLIINRLRQKKQIAEAAVVEAPVQVGPPMIDEVPAFETITNEEMVKGVELATTRTFHNGEFEILEGPVKAKTDSDIELVMFFANGNSQKEFYKEGQELYSALVRFKKDQKPQRLYFHSLCFNLVRAAVNAEMKKVYANTENTGEKFLVEEISDEEIKEISHRITMSDEEINAELLADERVPAPISMVPKENEIMLDEITVGKTSIKGKIPLTEKNSTLVLKVLEAANASYKTDNK